MQTAKEKVSNMASTAKEKAKNYKANVDEKVEKGTAMSHDEREMAHQRRKAKEAEANMEMHQEKGIHKAEKLDAKQSHMMHGGVGHHHDPLVPGTHGVGHTHDPHLTGAAAPTYPATGTGHKYI